MSSDRAKARAEANFKRKEEQAVQGANAWREYQAERRSVEEKTERLRALRLAKEVADAAKSLPRSKRKNRSALAPLKRSTR